MRAKLSSGILGVVLIAVFLGALLLAPGSARAQCEIGANSAPFRAAQRAAVTAAQNAIMLAVEVERMTANAAIGAAMNSGWTRMKTRLDQFYKDWLDSQKKQIAQLNAGQIDQSRQLGQSFSATDLQDAARRLQKSEYETKKEFMVSDEACRFDTRAKYTARNKQLSKAVTTSFANSFSMMGNNKAGTPAASGAASVQSRQWSSYVNKFCDPDANGGNDPCAAPPALRNAHIMPAKTVFAKDTINLDDPDTLEAVSQLAFNVSGFKVPDPMPKDVQTTSGGRQARQQNRENLTQMDAVGALVWSVIGERAVGEKADEIRQSRMRSGALDAAEKPSEREIRQSVLEDLWDPRYYIQLGDARGTVAQKEVYLKAYSLNLLDKLIARTEMINNVYAIEGANLLTATDTSRGSGMEAAKVR